MNRREELASRLHTCKSHDWDTCPFRDLYFEQADRLLPWVDAQVDAAVLAEQRRCIALAGRAMANAKSLTGEGCYQRIAAAIREGEKP